MFYNNKNCDKKVWLIKFCVNLNVRAALAPRDAQFFYTSFTQCQIHKSKFTQNLNPARRKCPIGPWIFFTIVKNCILSPIAKVVHFRMSGLDLSITDPKYKSNFEDCNLNRQLSWQVQASCIISSNGYFTICNKTNFK